MTSAFFINKLKAVTKHCLWNWH